MFELLGISVGRVPLALARLFACVVRLELDRATYKRMVLLRVDHDIELQPAADLADLGDDLAYVTAVSICVCQLQRKKVSSTKQCSTEEEEEEKLTSFLAGSETDCTVRPSLVRRTPGRKGSTTTWEASVPWPTWSTRNTRTSDGR